MLSLLQMHEIYHICLSVCLSAYFVVKIVQQILMKFVIGGL